MKTVAPRIEKQALGRALMSQSGTDEQVGNDVLKLLQQTRAEKQAALDKLRETMTASESAKLDAAIGKCVPFPADFKPSEAGRAFRESFRDIFETVKAKVNAALNAACDIPEMKGLASYEHMRGMLWQCIDGPAEHWQLMEDIELMPEHWQCVEDNPADRLSRLRATWSSIALMEDAAKNIRDPAFRKQVQAAVTFFKTEALPFGEEGIADLLMKEGTPGSPENIEILERFSANSHMYRQLVKVAGKDSDPVRIILPLSKLTTLLFRITTCSCFIGMGRCLSLSKAGKNFNSLTGRLTACCRPRTLNG